MAFVYPNSRSDVLEEIAAGRAPDSLLLGQNHLAEHGFHAFVHDPGLTRKRDGWLWWQLREVSLPFELRGADAIVTPLTRALPLASRILHGPAVVILSFGLNVQLRRTTPARRRIAIAALRAASRIVCLARSQRDELLALSGLPAEHVVAVELGIDAAFWSPRDVEQTPFVLSVGKDLARDYGTFADAVRNLGVPARTTALPRNLEGVDLPPNLETGVYPTFAELRDAYARAACVAVVQHPEDHPDGTEAGGLTALLEAMAMGKAIVATDRAAIREYVRDGETALLVPPGDAQRLGEAIGRVLADPDLAARLGAAARARVEERYTTPQFAARLAPVIRQAAQ